ncbi:YccF domain-containing protein [Latilactobacillus curvatus]|uniref:YccF domain-containing protein n=1 Tax=Latilactobacillus curvatus TaxID=28038 RepID=UPI00300E2E08
MAIRGLVEAIGWFILGIAWSITIIGIPVGLQCFKIGALTLMPFNATVVSTGVQVRFY